MVELSLECAIEGQVGSFEVTIDDCKKISALKKAIWEEIKAKFIHDDKFRSVVASDQQLSLAKKGAGWLPSAELRAIRKGEDLPGFERVSLVDTEDELYSTYSIRDVLDTNGMPPPQTRQIHVLVEVPQGVSRTEVCDMIRDGRGIRKWSSCNIQDVAKATVAAFASLLDRIPVIFIRAPPLSGKTALCDLLYDHIVRSKPDALVSRIMANQMPVDGKFTEFFKFLYGYDCGGIREGALESQIRGLRFVLFSSYGSFNIYRKFERAGTPILVPPQNTFGLNATPYKPGLQLSREELKEMAQNSIGISASDLIWILCSGHIGIARAILIFLHRKFGSGKPNDEDVELELRSLGLLQEIRSSYRGIPSADAFERVKDANNLPDEAVLKMIGILNGVASGKVMLVSDGHRTPRSQFAAELLTRYGFLYEDQAGQLQFASSMHLKIWLYSNRTDPISYMVSDVAHEDFVVACVQRMSALRLQNFANENTNGIARERQIQMELYGATVSCLPRDVFILWFWELLVNGDDAVGHSNRFETGGKYHGSLTGSSKYVLIDFRQSKGVRHQKHGLVRLHTLSSDRIQVYSFA
ncbi:hypothetical protein Plhal703r1_c25g0106011 [Plasmopara halstedii]